MIVAKKIVLGRQDVHVWRAALDATSEHTSCLELILSVAERQRAARFRRSQDREQFVIARGFLREVIGAYVQIDPADVQFDAGPKGKPFVRTCGVSEPVQFNLSHSDSIALLAITADRPVGIDIEKIPHDSEHISMMRHFFSAPERREYFRLDDAEKPRAFARLWTRKEAYLKALGEGLSQPLDSFTVPITSGVCSQGALSLETSDANGAWTVLGIDVPSGYEAALAAQGQIINVVSWIWQPGLPVWTSRPSNCVPCRDPPLPADHRD